MVMIFATILQSHWGSMKYRLFNRLLSSKCRRLPFSCRKLDTCSNSSSKP